ncbi:putative serine protease pcp-1 [Aphelenchoides besseyi]|nr:putative serine protease pcp-1 [Aphelenchoides besseyi]KAI6193897.1 putative serine protease pcp-1 [Aphelenchoides besseyi]
MRYLIGLILFVFLSTACAVRPPVPRLASATSLPYVKKYSPVYIDEYDSSYTQHFSLTYYINDTYYKDGGPVLFYTGNEGPIEGFVDNTQILLDIAPQLNALVVFAEHRYYGSTLPFGADSFKDTTKVAYLSVEQALRDYIQVVKDLRTNYPKLGKVVAVGGSYGGMLAAWARLLHSHVFDAAWAASAPLAYFRNSGVEFGAFHKVLTNALVTFGCSTDAVIKAFADLDNWGTTTKELQNLNKIFMTDPKSKVKNKDDIQSLKYFIRSTFESMAMANYPYRASFLRDNVGAWPFRKACKNLATIQDDPSASVRGLKKALDAYFGTNYPTCFKDGCPDSIDQNLGDLRGWNWQSCTELAISICAQGPPNDVFWPDCYNTTQGNVPSFTSYLQQQCDALNQDVSGYQNRMIDFDAVATYFGFDLKGATNIILTNGNLDPWSAGAPNIDVNSGRHSVFAPYSRLQDNIYVYNIEYGAHHLDLRAPNTCDPPTVTNARFQIVNILKCWTGQNVGNIDCSRGALQWPLPSWTLPTEPKSDCQYIYGQYPWGQTVDQSSSSSSPATGSSPTSWTSPSVSPQPTTKKGMAAIVPAISVIISFVFISLAHFMHL